MIAVIYGSTTGNTSDAAVKIAKILGEDQVELFDEDLDCKLIQKIVKRQSQNKILKQE